MRKLFYINFILGALFIQNLHAQNTLNKTHIIELGKYYSQFMLSNDAPKNILAELGNGYDANMIVSVNFVKEATKTKNNILTDQYLKIPDTSTLKVIYIINVLHQNPFLKTPKEPLEIVDSLINIDIPYHQLIDQYYQLLFTSVGNKNNPFDLSKVDFKLSEYGLTTDLYKSIFYLRCMDMCGSQIFGYMNIVDPPNTKLALKYINKFPQFEGVKYYEFTRFNFEDFQMEIFNDQGLQSYKSYFINDLFNTMLNHVVCLDKERSPKEVQDFFTTSTLKDESLWKYTEFQEVLTSIFK